MKIHAMFFFVILSLVTIQPFDAVEYKVINNVTNVHYRTMIARKIGIRFSLTTMRLSTAFILKTFQESKPEDLRKDVPQVIGLFWQDTDNAAAYTVEDGIHMNAKYLGEYSGDFRKEFEGMVFHEMTHVWQWFGDDKTPLGLTEGIADYVRLKAGFGKSNWAKPGEGDRWDHGYDVTARFLEYCEGLRNGFVAQLNKKLKVACKDEYFVEILGRNVHQLWRDYKSKYHNG